MSAKVFVGNLAFSTTSDELQALFAEAGEVAGVSVPADRLTGKPRGFAFVEFTNPTDAATAIQRFDGHELGGRRLRVNEAADRPAEGRSFGSGPGSGGGFGRSAGGGGRPARPKGSRRNIRGRKRGFV
jgi:RNA recognition motif-containing protein